MTSRLEPARCIRKRFFASLVLTRTALPMSSPLVGPPTDATAKIRTGFSSITRLQVILKPSPADVQDLYLQSLAAIGLHLADHDVRFEEDNWESPTLGAWGMGWQVLLDGLEITQFTYFQQSGGIDLDPVSVELTYGPGPYLRLPSGRRQRLRCPLVGGSHLRPGATPRGAGIFRL